MLGGARGRGSRATIRRPAATRGRGPHFARTPRTEVPSPVVGAWLFAFGVALALAGILQTILAMVL